ncbi:hypothetical protein HOY82DRAFT_77815 [Tuber indicum]|nr:hypothetical protein HOY82DRAFT_77815 [Tuber indicum]
MKKMRVSARYPGFLFPVTALRSNFFSTMATHYTTIVQAQAYHHRPPVASDHLEALVSCQLRQDKNPDRERMLVVNALKRATKNVEKKLYITGSQSSYYAYANGGGGRILAEITKLRKASEDQAVKLDSLKKEYSAKLEASEKKLSSIVEWAATMKPIQGVGISIRKRFFHNYMKSVGMASAKRYQAIRQANKVAHRGDFQTDTLLTTLGHLPHTRAFKDLYGVPHKRAEYYMKSNMIINIINKRATMIANRRRISRKWDEQLQSDFENIILFFHHASEEEWGRFEKDEAGESPEKKAWFRISLA